MLVLPLMTLVHSASFHRDAGGHCVRAGVKQHFKRTRVMVTTIAYGRWNLTAWAKIACRLPLQTVLRSVKAKSFDGLAKRGNVESTLLRMHRSSRDSKDYRTNVLEQRNDDAPHENRCDVASGRRMRHFRKSLSQECTAMQILKLTNSRCVLTFFVTLTVAGHCPAETSVNGAELRDLLSHMLDRLSVIHTGQCIVTGFRHEQAQPRVEEIAVDYAFDFTRPAVKLVWEGSGQMLRTEEYVFGRTETWRGYIQRFNSLPPTLGGIHFFDVRLLGLVSKPFGGPYEWSTDFDALKDWLNQASDFAATEEGDLLRLSFTLPGKHFDVRWHFWIDRVRGVTPWRFSADHDGELLSVIESEWEELGGVWVPVSVKTRSGPTLAAYSLDLSIQWLSVNEKLDELIFSPKSMVPAGEEGVVIVDPPEGEVRPIEVGVVSNKGSDLTSPDDARSRRFSRDAGAPDSPIADAQGRGAPASLILFLTGSAMAALGAFLFIRSRPAKA